MLPAIYLSDFRLSPHDDDIRFKGCPVIQTEQADENLIMRMFFGLLLCVPSELPFNKRVLVNA